MDNQQNHFNLSSIAEIAYTIPYLIIYVIRKGYRFTFCRILYEYIGYFGN